MARRKKARPAPAAAAPASPPAAVEAAPGASARRRRLAGAAIAVLAIGAAAAFWLTRSPPPPSAPLLPAAAPAQSASHVGAAACAECHAKEAAAWKGSHHDLAMQAADERSVLGDFRQAKFSYAGITSTFFRRDGRYFVNTDGPDGKLRDYEIRYAFGVTPLQQYLVEFRDGRLQALSIAWDSRPRDAGGQRWFHLYPGQSIKAGDRLHWTGLDQNWNFQCAECHSTRVVKNFDEKANRFATTWSEINVSCEACHGPGSNHLAWARKQGDWTRFDGPGKGLEAALDERRGVAWTLNPDTGNASRSRPRDSRREIEVCGRCHARRGQLTDRLAFGRSLSDTHRVALLEEGLYWPDGQMRDEVYNYGSFLQSRMFAQGVTCSDCHDPHTLKLRAPGNAACAQCHAPAKYDAGQHHHHEPGSTGAGCAACHMPATTYMVVDPRHDHGFRIPRPDRTPALGVPNACNQCHDKESPQWAAERVREWYPQPLPGFQRFAEALHAGASEAAGARDRLLAVAGDRGQPAIARASAVERLAAYPGPAVAEAAAGALNDDDPLLRRAAVEALAASGPDAMLRYLPRMLDDPVKSVRLEAARALAAAPPDRFTEAQRTALEKGISEWVEAQRFNADRPEAHANLGALHAARREFPAAQAEYAKALAMDPGFVPAAVNLADLFRALGKDGEAEATVLAALRRDPRNASLHYALGLTLTRLKRQADAVAEFREAAALAPGDSRFAYVYGVALHSTGRPAQGIKVLEDAHLRFPANRDILQALATMEHGRGNAAAALAYAKLLAEAAPDDPEAQALLQQLRRN